MALKKYWMVHGTGTPSVKHATAKIAVAEAERLARIHPGEAFTVLESMATVVKNELQWQDHEERDYEDDIPF